MSEILDLVEISKFAGERFDLVQAGGGNSSVKFDNGEMIIKASGFSLSDVNEKSGYSTVLTNEIAEIVNNKSVVCEEDKRTREKITSELVKKATIDKENRPSIETLLHSFLLKYTLHTHPIVVNIIGVQKRWKEILEKLFPNEKIALIEYQTPGIDLAISLDKELKMFESIPNIIFLQNHGLIITSDSKNEIFSLTNYVIEKLENYIKLDLSKYKLTNKISELVKRIEKTQNISYLSEDGFLNTTLKTNKELFFKPPFCPDSLVYCGACAIEIENFVELGIISAFRERYHEIPKVVLYQDKLFIVTQNIKKAKEIEEVLKFQIMILSQNKNDINFLSSNELAYLSNWEAEKFRQKL